MVNLKSENIDPCITVQMLDEMKLGELMPSIEGISTAYHAHNAYPKLTLEVAVSQYLKDKEDKDDKEKNKAKGKVEKEKYPYDFMNRYEKINIADWDNYNQGQIMGKIGDNTSDIEDRVDTCFIVENVNQARIVIGKVLAYIDKEFDVKPGIRIHTLAFSGFAVYVLSDPNGPKFTRFSLG
jgi:hypothetical protein